MSKGNWNRKSDVDEYNNLIQCEVRYLIQEGFSFVPITYDKALSQHMVDEITEQASEQGIAVNVENGHNNKFDYDYFILRRLN